MNNATGIEMFALCNYADAIGKGTDSTFGSWSTLKNFAFNAEYLGEFSLGDYEGFISVKQDWGKMVSSMTDTYMKAGVYKQVLDGQKLATILNLCKDSVSEENIITQTDEIDLREFISTKRKELYEKIKNGDTQVRIQTGAQSFTEEEAEQKHLNK